MRGAPGPASSIPNPEHVMTIDLIERARQRITAAQRKRAELEAEKARLEEEVARLESFIETAATLAEPGTNTVPEVAPRAAAIEKSNRPQLIIGSHAEVAAKLILASGPRTLDQLLVEMQKMGREDGENFRANVSSALWRRKNDVFDRKDKESPYTLRTTNFVFVPP